MSNKINPHNSIYNYSNSEFVGIMPIRTELTFLPADEPRQLKLGWVVSEKIGIGISNRGGVIFSIEEKSHYICG